MSIAPPKRYVAHYELGDPLGAGGMGQVFRAKDTRLGRHVALKILSTDFAASPDRLRRFEQEARAASALSHPNIVTVYDVGTTETAPYIAMELIEGRTLRDLLRAGPIPPKRLLEIAARIADGLARAHEAGIVHRDIKPENIMISRDGIVKILDFGLAKRTIASGGTTNEPTITLATEPGTVLGTVRYMSPEQASGRPVDFRSDQFSFGSVLYEMAGGRPAFTGETNVDTLSSILHSEPEPLSRLSPNTPAPLRWIIERCQAKDPQERYASTADLARDLADVRERLTGSSPGISVDVFPPRRGKRAFSLVLPAALLALGVVGGYLLWGRRAGAEPPSFRQLTFRNGSIVGARFAPDDNTVVFSANWDGKPIESYFGRTEGPEFRPFGLSGADVLAVSKSGEMAVSLNRRWFEPFKLIGTLAEMGISSAGAPREILDDVFWADWSPDGRSLAVVRELGGLSTLEYPIGKVLYQEPAGYISHPRVSRSGDLVAFLDHPAVADDAGGVAVVDRAGKRKDLVTGFSAVWGLAWSSDGTEVWFTGASTGISRALYAVTLSGRRRLISRVTGSIRLDDVSPTSRALITHEHVKQHLVALGSGDARERDLSWLDYSLSRAISPDGTAVLFVEGGEGGGPGYSAFFRKTDGSPAIRLGEGDPVALSPDARSALALVQKPSGTQLVLYPVGTGEAHVLATGNLRVVGGDFLPDGKRILFWAADGKQPVRLYVQNIDAPAPRPISPVGYRGYAGTVSPDGKWVAVIRLDQKVLLYPIEGGEPRLLATITEDDAPCGWTADGRYLFLVGAGGRPRKVDRLEVATGKREPWKSIEPYDPSGSATAIRISRDGSSYAYTYIRDDSDLYLTEGLR
jgi:Tol biopolymer transport system component